MDHKKMSLVNVSRGLVETFDWTEKQIDYLNHSYLMIIVRLVYIYSSHIDGYFSGAFP